MLPNRNGNRLNHLLRRLKGIAGRAGVKAATLHKFRRTYAMRLLEGGADIVTVQKLMGHSDIETTRRYLNPEDGPKRKAANRLRLPSPPLSRISHSVDESGLVDYLHMLSRSRDETGAPNRRRRTKKWSPDDVAAVPEAGEAEFGYTAPFRWFALLKNNGGADGLPGLSSAVAAKLARTPLAWESSMPSRSKPYAP